MVWTRPDIWVTRIEFRRDPTRPSENRVSLGFAMGLEVRKGFFRRKKRSILMLTTRKPEDFSEAERAALGPTYRRLLLERPGYLIRAFERAISGTKGPFEALKNFAAENRAALSVKEPQKLKVPLSVLQMLQTEEAKNRALFSEAVAAVEAWASPQNVPDSRRKLVRGKRAIPPERLESWTTKARQYNGQGWTESPAF
jgi:hypothetical protein